VFESAPPAGISPSCDTAGIIGPIVAVIAGMQVAEALKILAGCRDRINRGITTMDLWENRREAVKLPPPQPDCPCCGRQEFPYLDGSFGAKATTLCGGNSVQIRGPEGVPVDLDELAHRLGPTRHLEQNRYLLQAAVDGYQLTVFADGRAIINGTCDPAIAESLYARYVGS
jgi:hypothetical protein